ncbi:MAG: hypothetical protein ACAH88_02390 [Roseimicrobium sp.]
MKSALLCLLALAAALPVSAQDSILKQATFCRGLAENQTPGEKAESFMPEDTVYLSVELKGRPKSGTLGCRFLIEETLIAEAKVDVSSVNKGVLFSVGQSTFAGFNLTHANALPVGDMYHAEISLDGKVLGTFPFRIAPPKTAIESKFKSSVFEKEVAGERQPLEADAALAPEDNVIFKGVADLGVGTWLRVTWLVNGKPDPKGTRSLTMEENKADCGFFFSFRPDQGWPVGKHEASLVINGKEAARRAFTVKTVLPARLSAQVGQIQPTAFALYRGDEKGEKLTEVPAFSTSDTMLFAEWSLKVPANVAGVQYVWTLVDAGGEKDVLIAKADMPEGVYKRLRTSLKLNAPPPVGKYRVDLLLNGKVIDSRPFEVK